MARITIDGDDELSKIRLPITHFKFERAVNFINQLKILQYHMANRNYQ